MAPVPEGTQKFKYAVVTGSYKGIGFETVKYLASQGINVVLTARNVKKGLESHEKLKAFGLPGQVLFHQLDVCDDASVASFADFIKTQFGKLDILINNAGLAGLIPNSEAFNKAFKEAGGWPADDKYWEEITVEESYDLTKEAIDTNYYGAKRIVEALLPYLQKSEAPRIVNVASSLGSLRFIPNEWAKELWGNVEQLTEERLEEVLTAYLKAFKEGKLKENNWPVYTSAYKMSKGGLNTYTRLLAKKYPFLCVNSVCPGYCKSDMTCGTGLWTVEDGAKKLCTWALQPEQTPSGVMVSHVGISPF
ncbi:hypothetical protein FNV43_RR15214 [Rhamnella rubrinervis]|uniref:(+)-neomenthol dehydrogenase-like n=1 Tax=Rhamnella rubrinervis TaxID=2594499 RepID=A0A8K0E6X1_9ROSA|nr:hypothetical protein FNV43_RR15214 [Rhamnella rubrinervis]